MYDSILSKSLTDFAHKFAIENYGVNYLHPVCTSKSAVIFKEIMLNFHPKSWLQITMNQSYLSRTTKIHSHFKGATPIIHSHFKGATPIIYEMQSSNSSDALAMNIFCFPNFSRWSGMKTLFGVSGFNQIEFGFEPKIIKRVKGKNVIDSTEVDIYINDSIFCECKLTESNFTNKEKESVENYAAFTKVFHVDELVQSENHYHNYQLIRNILAAEQHNCKFYLICDMRRPDLAKSFYQTIRCIKDEYVKLRTDCEIIYWQDIANVADVELKKFLNEKYGI